MMEKELKSKIDFLCNKKYNNLSHLLKWINKKFIGFWICYGYETGDFDSDKGTFYLSYQKDFIKLKVSNISDNNLMVVELEEWLVFGKSINEKE